jgi:hypothetical protein
MLDNKDTEVKAAVYENSKYTVNIIRVPDMYFDTYGVINKDTKVIEQIHPNLYNARKIADQFDKWLLTGPDADDEEISGEFDMFHGAMN